MKNKEIMVRVCKDCGTVYSAKAKRCEICGTRLGDPIENDKGIKQGEDIQSEKEKRSEIINDPRNSIAAGEEYDPGIEVGPGRIVCGVLGIITAIAMVVFLVLVAVKKANGGLPGDSDFIDFFKMNFAIALLLAIAIPESFAPNFMWKLKHFTSPIYYENAMYPSDTGKVMGMIAAYILTLLCIAAVVIEYWLLFFL